MLENYFFRRRIAKEVFLGLTNIKLLVLTGILFFLGGHGYGQIASQYVYSQSNGVFSSISGTTLGSGSSLDNGTYTISAASLSGFSFLFSGTSYTAFTVSPNGFIGFGSSLMGGTLYTPLSTTGGGNVFASPMAADLEGIDATTKISWVLTGSAPNRIFTVEWLNMKRKSQTSNLNFQVKLYETTNAIEFVYGTNTYTSATANTFQIGIKNSTVTTLGSEGWQNRETTSPHNWNTTTRGAANTSSATLVSTATPPSSGLIMKWVSTTCFPPTALTTTAIGEMTARLSWTSPATSPASYDIYYGIGSASTPLAVPTASTPATTTSTTNIKDIVSLTANTSYQYYVRSACGGGNGNSTWTGPYTFLTDCEATNVPYALNFESVTVPAIPSCTSIQNAGTGNDWKTLNNPGYGNTTKVLHYQYHSANAANAWFYTQRLNLTSGVSYRLSFKYNSGSTSFTERLKIAYGSSALSTAMTNTIYTNAIINNTAAFQSVTLDFVPATTGAFYIGFNAYSIADQHNLYVDDISVTLSPTDAVDYANIQSPGVSTTVTGTPTDIFGRAYEPGLTPLAGAPAGLTVWYSTNATDVDPSSAGWTGTWTPATYNIQVGNDDEWKGTIYPISGQADTYYSFRYQLNGGPYRYGGYPNGFWNGTTQKNGKLSVNYDVYTNSAPKTINDVITINFRDFDATNMFYTSGESTVYAYAGIRIVGGTDFNYAQGNINTISSLIPFTLSGGIYSATIKLADYFCIPVGVNVDGVNIIFRNQYFTGGNCDGTFGNNDKTCDLYLDLTNATVQLNAPTLTAATAITTTTATINWTAPTSGVVKGYDYYYSTSATAPIASTTPSGSTISGVLNANLSSLIPSTLYNVWVRTKGCGTDVSAWSVVRTFTTLAAPPANDACTNATSLPCGTSGLAGTTVGSVFETIAVSGWTTSGYGVWYTFAGDGNLNTISTTAASGFDHELSIASGLCGSFTNIASVDLTASGGTESHSFVAYPGITYYVYISYWEESGNSSNVGAFTISRTCTPVTYCIPSSSAGSQANNFINKVSFLGTLNDTSNTSTYSSTSAGYENFTSLPTRSSQIQGEPINVSVDINTNSNLRAWVDWNKDGDFTDSGETIFDSTLANALLSSATFGFVVPNVLPGNYRIRIRTRGNATFDSCSANNSSDTEDYLFTVIGRCAAEIFTVAGGERCGPGSVNLSATGTSGVQFKWYTAAVGGSLLATTATGSYTANVTSTTSFYVTAFNGSCETQIRKEVVAIVKELADITIPASLESCGDTSPIVLTASADREIVYLLNENFESGIGTMSSVENGSSDAIAKWRTKTGPFKPNEAQGTWLPVISSGFGSNTFATATSDMGIENYSLDNSLQPTNVINTTGFLNLTLKFRMYFSRFYTDNIEVTGQDEFVTVEVSTNGGTTWVTTPIVKYVTDIGNPGNFQHISLNLNAYINQSSLKFRIRYKTQKWTHGLAVDDIQLYGEKTLVPSFTWSGAGLNVFEDAALTIPYVAGTPASTVYAVPDIATLGNASFNIDVSTTVTNGCAITRTINVTNKSKIWNGSVSSAWNDANNWSPAGIPTNTDCVIIPSTTVNPVVSANANGKNLQIKSSGELSVNSERTLTIEDAVNVNSGGSLTFENSASLVQINENPLINKGNIIYKRNTSDMLRYSYTYWSSPVYATSQTLSALSPATLADKYFSWDIDSQSWLLHRNGGIAMEKAKGYIVRAPQTFPISGTAESYHAEFNGVPNNGLITIGTQGSTTVDKWNLIGNPYPSALIADSFLSNTVNPDLEGTIYLWTNFAGVSSVPNAGGTYPYTANDYAVYNFSGGTATAPADGDSIMPTGFVGAGQAFFVKGISNGNGTATFNNTMRKGADNNQFFRTQNTATIEKNRIWLNLENSQGGFNQALIAYIEGATDGYDRGYDGELFGGNSATFYSIIPSKRLTIQGKSLPFAQEDIVPMGYKTTVAGNYRITLDHFDGMFESQNIYIKDNLLNVVHDIKNAPYNFTTTIGTFENRFEVVYQNGSLDVKAPQFNPESIIVYQKDKSIYVNAGLVSIDQLKVFDIHGRLIYDAKNINNTEAVIKSLPSVDQVLIIQVTTVNGNKVSKKLVH